MEIGVLIDDLQQIDAVRIYLPLTIDRSMVEDCAPYLTQPKFAQGIFNEVLATTVPAAGGSRSVILHYQNNDTFCRVYRFGNHEGLIDSAELELQQEYDGTVLTITRKAVDEACRNIAVNDPSYFRVRIALRDAENPFIEVIKPWDRFFVSGFDEIEYIDFRVNEARTLPEPIEHRMRSEHAVGGPLVMKLLAFLTAVPVNSDLSASNTPSHKMRLLEDSWRDYVSSGIPKGMVVYHWKREHTGGQPISDFSAFVKLETRRTGWIALGVYLLIALVFGVLGNLIASEIWDASHPSKPTAEKSTMSSPRNQN